MGRQIVTSCGVHAALSASKKDTVFTRRTLCPPALNYQVFRPHTLLALASISSLKNVAVIWPSSSLVYVVTNVTLADIKQVVFFCFVIIYTFS